MNAIHEYNRIICVQASLQPLRYVTTDVLDHPRYTRLAVMLSIYLIEHLSNLRLGQPFGIQASCKPLAFLFLILQNGQNLRMKVAETVSRYPELQLPAVAVCMPQTIAVPFVPVRLLLQKLATLRYHQTLQHDLEKIVYPIFFLGMLAHYLRKLFLCKCNHKSVVLKIQFLS